MPLNAEAKPLDQRHHLVVRQLDGPALRNAETPTTVIMDATALLALPFPPRRLGPPVLRARRIVLKVPQQRAQVDPHAALLQTVGDGLDVVDQIRRRVDEEDARDRVERGAVLRAAVRDAEVGRRHAHPRERVRAHARAGRAQQRRRMHVGHAHGLQLVRAAGVVRERVRPRVHGELLGARRVVEDEGRRHQLVVRDLVALDGEAQRAELDDQPPQARARHEHADLVAVRGRHGGVLGGEGGQDGAVAGAALGGAGGAPVAVHLPERAAGLFHVGGGGGAAPAGLGGGVGVAGAGDVRVDAEVWGGGAEDGFGQVGVGVDGVVDGIEGVKEGEGGLGQEVPVGGGHGVEVLSADVRHVVVGYMAVGPCMEGELLVIARRE